MLFDKNGLLADALQELLIFRPIAFGNLGGFHGLLKRNAKVVHKCTDCFHLTILSAFIPALDLHIVCTSRLVHCQNVQPDGPALKIFDVMLPVDLHYTPYFFRFAKGVFRKSARYSQFFQFTI